MTEALSFDFLAKDGVSSVCDKISGSLDRLHGRFGHMAKVSGDALLGVATAATGAGLSTLKMAADFQEGMTTLVTGAGESEKNMKLVSDGILNMAGAVGTSTKQLTDGMYMVESAGFHGAAGLNVLKVAAEGAKVGATDLGTMANAVTSALNAYHLPAAKAAQVTNTLVATVASGKMHMSELAGSLGAVLPAASAAHLSLIQVGAAMATMTAQGTPAADAATYLRQTILNLMNPTAKARDEMKSLGISYLDISKNLGRRGLTGTFDVLTAAIVRHMGKAGTVLIEHLRAASHNTTAFQKVLANLPPTQQSYVAALAAMVGGTKSMQSALELTGGNAKTFKGNVEAITKAVGEGGTKVQGWSLVQKDFNTQMSMAKETVSALGIRIGQKLLPIGEKFLKWLLNLITQLTDGKKHTKGLAGFIENDLVPAVKKIAGWVKDTLIPALRDMWHWFQNKVLPVIVRIAKDVLPTARREFNETGKAIAKHRPELEKLRTAFAKIIDFVVKYVLPILGPELKFIFVGIGTQIRTTITVIGLLVKAFEAWRTITSTVIRFIANTFLTFVGLMISGAAKAFGWVPGLGGKLKTAAAQFFKFRDDVNRAIDSLNPGKTIKVTAYGYIGGSGPYAHKPLPLAAGGPVPLLPGSVLGRDSVAALLSPREYVLRADGSNLPDAIAHFGRRMADGGVVGKIASNIGMFPAAFDRTVTAIFTKAMQRLLDGMAGAVGGGFGAGGTGGFRALGRQLAASMGLAGQFGAIDYIFTHESGWNPRAQNPTSTAYGIPQFLDATWGGFGGKTSDPARQIVDGISYMVRRYGSPNAAAAFWRGHHWYDQGGWLEPGVTIAHNNTGRRERVSAGDSPSITINGDIVLRDVTDPASLIRKFQDYCRTNGPIRGLKFG